MAITITRPIIISDETEKVLNALQMVFDGYAAILDNIETGGPSTDELAEKIFAAKEEALKLVGFHIENSMLKLREDKEAIVI